MDTDILALTGFAFASSITPGPNNLMLMASGANYGIVRSLPHWLGVTGGFVILMTITGMGVGAFILGDPEIKLGFRLVCFGVILWLAWRIATASRPHEGQAAGKPLTFLQAAAFQWVNPKAWAMALAAISIYAASEQFEAILLVALVFGAVNVPSTAVWLISGERIQRLLHKDAHFRIFNFVMAVLLIGSALPMLVG